MFVLILAELFWFFAGTIIHEYVHASLFFIETGKWETPHVMDKVAYSHGYLAVTIPPAFVKVGTIFSSETHEIIAYSLQFCTAMAFAYIL